MSIVRFPNQLNGDGIDFDAYLQQNSEPENLLPAFAYQDLIIERMYGDAPQGLLLPWSKTHGRILLRPGGVSLWAGINGHGKSLLLNQVVLQALKCDEPAVIASMEMLPEVTMERMVCQAAGSSLPSEAFIRRFCNWAGTRLWLFVQRGTVKPQRMLSVLRYCESGLMVAGEKIRVKHFVIDSLMKCGIAPDDYERQKLFIDELFAHALRSGVHIHLVAHSRKGESERKMPDKFDVKGTSEITDQVDNVFIVWRNKRKEDEAAKPQAEQDQDAMKKPDAVLICAKQRHGRWEGKVPLWFHRDSQQFVGYDGARPIPFVPDA